MFEVIASDLRDSPLIARAETDVIAGIGASAVDGAGFEGHGGSCINAFNRHDLDGIRADLLEEDVGTASCDIEVHSLTQVIGQADRDVGSRLGTSSYFYLAGATGSNS